MSRLVLWASVDIIEHTFVRRYTLAHTVLSSRKEHLYSVYVHTLDYLPLVLARGVLLKGFKSHEFGLESGDRYLSRNEMGFADDVCTDEGEGSPKQSDIKLRLVRGFCFGDDHCSERVI